MSWIDFFRGKRKEESSASAAKERLQIVLAHERIGRARVPWRHNRLRPRRIKPTWKPDNERGLGMWLRRCRT